MKRVCNIQSNLSNTDTEETEGSVRIREVTMITSLLRPQCSVSKIKPKTQCLVNFSSKLINVIVLLGYMLYTRFLQQNEILRLRHVLVLVSLTDKVSMFV